ncbi:hypothetical protein [Rhodoferax antarcticus]|uniref:hypothetical protein n=1 Tax=Rhodoferax antarcticus TaxID=81479 RepID=UPI002223FE02|nr:hypothetical protein [Rhodoferax antarcticus]MCW2313993.1 transposase [Rhodoferax antarcticus]
MISMKKMVTDSAEGRQAARAALAELADLTNVDQRIAFLADAIGEQIDVCLGMNNLTPTECRLYGFAEVLQKHLRVSAGLSQTTKMPVQGVNEPGLKVPV